jgi:hypothetical protein
MNWLDDHQGVSFHTGNNRRSLFVGGGRFSFSSVQLPAHLINEMVIKNHYGVVPYILVF